MENVKISAFKTKHSYQLVSLKARGGASDVTKCVDEQTFPPATTAAIIIKHLDSEHESLPRTFLVLPSTLFTLETS